MTNTDKYMVLLGLDKDKKPRAARFASVNEVGVRKLASINGYRIGHAKTDEAIEIVLKLVDGKIFHTGAGLVPLVKPETFEKLLQVLEIEPATAPPTGKEPAPTPQQSEASGDPWAKIKVGSVVLCPNDDKIPSWWQTTVTGISKDGKTLTLSWTQYPKLKPFTFRRKDVALLPSKARA